MRDEFAARCLIKAFELGAGNLVLVRVQRTRKGAGRALTTNKFIFTNRMFIISLGLINRNCLTTFIAFLSHNQS